MARVDLMLQQKERGSSEDKWTRGRECIYIDSMV